MNVALYLRKSREEEQETREETLARGKKNTFPKSRICLTCLEIRLDHYKFG